MCHKIKIFKKINCSEFCTIFLIDAAVSLSSLLELNEYSSAVFRMEEHYWLAVSTDPRFRRQTSDLLSFQIPDKLKVRKHLDDNFVWP